MYLLRRTLPVEQGLSVSYKRLHALLSCLLLQSEDNDIILTQMPTVYIIVDIKLHRLFYDNYHLVIHMHISTVELVGLTI